jgi:uncharacterized integral membrane protein
LSSSELVSTCNGLSTIATGESLMAMISLMLGMLIKVFIADGVLEVSFSFFFSFFLFPFLGSLLDFYVSMRRTVPDGRL